MARPRVVNKLPLLLRAATRGESPPMRELTILAQDPSVKIGEEIVLTKASITAEPLQSGPCGARIKVVDYDGTTDTLYLPRNHGYEKNAAWDDPFKDQAPAKLIEDPQFHQQNVYAAAMQTLARFEFALGRRVNFGFQGHQLHIAPHAFADANAYYQRESRCLSFGYFPDPEGNVIYTCLSHDIVAHESTHALLDGLRPRYLDPSSPDQGGFHEGFADVVALLSVLAEKNILLAVLTKKKVIGKGGHLVDPRDLTLASLQDSVLLGLAEEMGDPRPNGSRDALRRSVKATPDPKWRSDPDWEEPHRRGEILVNVVMNAFLRVWIARNTPLTPVSGEKFDGTRIVEEGATAARHLLNICIRAIDYAPTTDLQFEDYLSALLTADKETAPDDSRYGYREEIRAGFKTWGILAASRQRSDGCWEPFDQPVSYRNIRFESLQRNTDEAFRFLWENFEVLKLAQDAYTEVQGVRPIARVAPDGLIVRETVVDYMQILTVRGHELGSLGLRRPLELATSKEVRIYGGGVLIFDEFGRLKYSIGNNIANRDRQQRRIDYLAKSGFFEYSSDAAFTRGYFARLHLDRAIDAWEPKGARK
jgi:hypothetical protein